ncbi:DUF5068 domain-containing protein [Cytobacillus solani]|uniref:DUF5068 domain-containing protein n=1 Tax=Cytobacillus solani TaxID=1637975 RepID=UPI0006AB93E6|nr:DUF5068 domain-containing protein [Cytobacillus solani]KOP78816.1 hypothetical protein AMS60_18365 [Bacillus sp. FJAT-21945]USK55290.1 DUF5068 domain-containing protein [Cytobacillus solani]
MPKKLVTLLIAMLVAAFVLAGCSGDKQASKEKESEGSKETAAAEADKKEKNEDTEKETEDTTEGTDSKDNEGSSDFSELISYMEKETEGTTKILYENDTPQKHEMEGVSVSLDAYKLVELKDFHTDFMIPFNDQTNGGVIIAKYTVKNETDKDAYYMPAFYLNFTGASKAYNNYRDLLPEEEQLPTKLAPSNGYLIKSGETISGYYTYPFGDDHLKQVLNLSTAAIEVPAPLAVKDDFSSSFGKEGQFTLSLNESGEKKVEGNKSFYQDKATIDDMGTKTMIEEKNGIGKSEPLGDATVTLDGYQFTEFVPNEVEAPRFEAFNNGVVLLTVKFNIDNKGASEIAQSSISSKLTVNDGTQYMLNEGMLLNYKYSDVIAPGAKGELLQIYVLEKEMYDKIWKDKSFEVEVGPMRDKEAKDLSKGKKVTFTLK